MESVDILLIEDDPADKLLVEEFLADTALNAKITWFTTLAEARPHLASFRGCVLLDLNLPDARGMDLLREVLDAAKSAAVVVLTGLDDEHEGIAAVAAGAQDYLVKGKSTARCSLAACAIRWNASAPTKRAAVTGGRTARPGEHAPGTRPPPATVTRRVPDGAPVLHRPGRKRALVGGDFFDAVDRDGTTHLIVGDVSGHGPTKPRWASTSGSPGAPW